MHTDGWDSMSQGVGKLTGVFLRQTQTDPNEPAQDTSQPLLSLDVHVQCRHPGVTLGWFYSSAWEVHQGRLHPLRERERERSRNNRSEDKTRTIFLACVSTCVPTLYCVSETITQFLHRARQTQPEPGRLQLHEEARKWSLLFRKIHVMVFTP